jgi:flagellar biosynthesis protein FlhG
VSEVLLDQATGLRRLLGAGAAVRSVAFAACGKSGAGAGITANAAFALARRGSRVFVFDEGGEPSMAARFGLRPGHDLTAVMAREHPLAEVVVDGPEGVRFLAAGRGVARLAHMSFEEEQGLIRAFSALDPAPDMLIADAAALGDDVLPRSVLAAGEVVVVVCGGATDAITEAYALMKRLAWDFARRRCHVLVCRVRERERAEVVFGNLRDTASRYLGLELRWLGWIPDDESMRKAERLHQPVIGAFPDSGAAQAFRDVAETVSAWPFAGEHGLGGFVQRLVRASRIAALDGDH